MNRSLTSRQRQSGHPTASPGSVPGVLSGASMWGWLNSVGKVFLASLEPATPRRIAALSAVAGVPFGISHSYTHSALTEFQEPSMATVLRNGGQMSLQVALTLVFLWFLLRPVAAGTLRAWRRRRRLALLCEVRRRVRAGLCRDRVDLGLGSHRLERVAG